MRIEERQIGGRDIYIYGAGFGAKICIDLFGEYIQIEGIIESDCRRIGATWQGYPIVALDCIEKGSFVFVSVINEEYKKEIKKLLIGYGLNYERDFCFFEDISDFVYKFSNRIVENYMELYITNRCTLRCKDCTLLIPYVKECRDISYSEIVSSLEHYFRKVDKVREIHLLGGEPLLHRQLKEVTEYICENYGNRFDNMAYVTNGTVLPDEMLIQYINSKNKNGHKIRFIISEYPLQMAIERREKLIKILNDNEISYSCIGYTEWHSLFEDSFEKIELTEDGVKSCLSCDMGCRTLYGDILYYCSVDSAAKRNEIISSSGKGEIDLKTQSKDEIAERLYQYRQKTFDKSNCPDFCDRCYGYPGIMSRSIPVAEQINVLK